MKTIEFGWTRICLLTIIALAAIGLCLIPTKLLYFLTMWMLVSVPIGVLFGHLVPKEE